MRRRWIYRPTDGHASRTLAERLRVNPIAAQVLLNRGLASPEDARSFLSPELRHLCDPFLFRDMERAAERVRAAVERREPIVVYGDYDVDGLTATTVLVRLLRILGADVRPLIPERSEGYGMQPARVAALAAEGARLIVAVDNGTSAFGAIEVARAAGVDVIVTDHHPPGAPAEDGGRPRIPEVLALINPKVEGETYPFPDLCGAGVAFKLAWAIAGALSPGKRASPELREYLLEALAFVAIGTVADMVPLAGENRAMVHFGLKVLDPRVLATRPYAGLRALLESARIARRASPDDVAFRIAPRLNAAGRMGSARLGFELLAAADGLAAREIAERLDRCNRERQELERRILAEALGEVESALAAAGGRAIVLARQGWPLGVLGIVASRLVERFYRPAVLIALDGERGRGSARSVPGVALPEAFERCREHLVGFGGHAAAAGLEILAAEVGAFRERLGAVLGELPPSEDAAPPLSIDAEVALADISHGLVSELARMEPHGYGNAPPLFAAREVALAAEPRAVGRGGEHLKVLLRQGRAVVPGIGFGLGASASALRERGGRDALEIAFRPVISSFNGSESVELEVRDLRVADRCASRP